MYVCVYLNTYVSIRSSIRKYFAILTEEMHHFNDIPLLSRYNIYVNHVCYIQNDDFACTENQKKHRNLWCLNSIKKRNK